MARAATASRPQAGRRIESRWAGSMKFVSNFLEMGEYASIAGSALLCDAVTSPEQRNGYLAQVEDEVRHTNQLGYIKKYLASQYHNPPDSLIPGPKRTGKPSPPSNAIVSYKGRPTILL